MFQPEQYLEYLPSCEDKAFKKNAPTTNKWSEPVTGLTESARITEVNGKLPVREYRKTEK